MKIIHLIAFFLLLSCSSCYLSKKATTTYLENVKDSTFKELPVIPEPVIQKNDLLYIRVFSLSVDRQVDAPYNLPDVGMSSGGTNNATSGFLVDPAGNIEFPQIGTIHAEGLTKSALAETIRQKLSTSLKQPSVMVRFLNYKITVLGEVGAQGTLTVPTEKVTILEAVGMAGGVTDLGNMKGIKVLRENNGQREIGNIDITSRGMFSSPYYYLQQNDVVLVEPNERKLRNIQRQERQAVGQDIGLAMSVITAVALILNLIK